MGALVPEKLAILIKTPPMALETLPSAWAPLHRGVRFGRNSDVRVVIVKAPQLTVS